MQREENQEGQSTAESWEELLALPPHGTEIFVGGLPRMVTEEELKEFAETVGSVYSVKILKEEGDETKNRGHGFVTYQNIQGALAALDRLHKKEMDGHPGHPVRVNASEVKNRLYVHGMPQGMSEEEIRKEVVEAHKIQGVEEVVVPKKTKHAPDGKGFAFLYFYNSACANKGKEILSKTGATIGGGEIKVDLADPGSNDTSGLRAPKVVFVGSLPDRSEPISENIIKDLFAPYGPVEKVMFPRNKESNYVFVYFTERVSAYNAVHAEEKPRLGDTQLTVRFGKPEGHYGDHSHRGRGAGQSRIIMGQVQRCCRQGWCQWCQYNCPTARYGL